MMTESADTYFDPDDVGPRDSPILKPMRIKLIPSPPPEVKPPPPISFDSGPGGRKGGKRPNHRACQADAVLVGLMGGGKRPDIARNAGDEALPSDEDEDDESPVRGTAVEIPARTLSPAPTDFDITRMAADAVNILDRAFPRSRENSHGSTGGALAVSDALANANANSQAQNATDATKSNNTYSNEPYQNATVEVSIRVDTQSTPPNATGELPPMRHSPQSGLSNGNGSQQITLPSLKESLDNIEGFVDPIPTLNEASYSQSPGRPSPRFVPGLGATSPANARNGLFKEIISPGRPSHYRQFVSNSPRRFSQSDGPQYVASADYSSGSNTETPSTEQSGSTPATMAIDRMSIDGITHPQVGGFQCNNPGCNAPPFQTQV